MYIGWLFFLKIFAFWILLFGQLNGELTADEGGIIGKSRYRLHTPEPPIIILNKKHLLPYGEANSDRRFNSSYMSEKIDLHAFFPLTGSLAESVIVHKDGALTVIQDEHATSIAPFCGNLLITGSTEIFYRVVYHQDLFGQGNVEAPIKNLEFFRQKASDCSMIGGSHTICNPVGDATLDALTNFLMKGTLGAVEFEADAALIITWENLQFVDLNIKNYEYASLQVIIVADFTNFESYIFVDYARPQYYYMYANCDIQNVYRNTNNARLNLSTGNQDFDHAAKHVSTWPSRVIYRADQHVLPMDRTLLHEPLTSYPDIVSYHSGLPVAFSGLQFVQDQNYSIRFENDPNANCAVSTNNILHCPVQQEFSLNGSTSAVYTLTSNHVLSQGTMHIVPPVLDPLLLDIGYAYKMFLNPLPEYITISWYPRNFSIPKYRNIYNLNDNILYDVRIGVYVVAYNTRNSSHPSFDVLCRLATFNNRPHDSYRFEPQIERVYLNTVEHWYLTAAERELLFTRYSVGFLKLAVLEGDPWTNRVQDELKGIVSTPIALHFLWTIENAEFDQVPIVTDYRQEAFVAQKATQFCKAWIERDKKLPHVGYSETRTPCPCTLKQAKADFGRFVPHPACSQASFSKNCQFVVGSNDCLVSLYADNQLCCYDKKGYLIQTLHHQHSPDVTSVLSYPSFSMRASVFNTMEAFEHDYIPYTYCCQLSNEHCKDFASLRPSSRCTSYRAPYIGYTSGSGAFSTFNAMQFVFTPSGVFKLFYIPQSSHNSEIRIQGLYEPFRIKDNFTAYGSLLTGVAVEASGTKRVTVLTRFNDYAYRHRTTILVDGIEQQFDRLRFRRYPGLYIYISHDVNQQEEINIVFYNEEVGIRIRDYFGEKTNFFDLTLNERIKGLDVTVSVAPKYNYQITGLLHSPIALAYGLMNPRLNHALLAKFFFSLGFNAVNHPELIKSLQSKYSVSLNEESSDSRMPTENFFKFLFTNEAPYAFAKIEKSFRARVLPLDGVAIFDRVRACQSLIVQKTQAESEGLHVPMTEELEYCIQDAGDVGPTCGANVACFIAYALFHSRSFAVLSGKAWNNFTTLRTDTFPKYMSCRADLDIKYPKSLSLIHVNGSGYFQYDVIKFACDPAYTLVGDEVIQCHKDPDPYIYPNQFWNLTTQPQCIQGYFSTWRNWLIPIIKICGTVSFFGLIIILGLYCLLKYGNRPRSPKHHRMRTSENSDVDESML